MGSPDAKSKIFTFLKNNGIALSIFIILAVVLINGLSATDDSRHVQERRQIENNIHQAIINCYAIEGMYPPTLNYLIDNYGLHIDSEKYVVHYTAIGSNIMPEVTIIEV